jgi:hypothetical protein
MKRDFVRVRTAVYVTLFILAAGMGSEAWADSAPVDGCTCWCQHHLFKPNVTIRLRKTWFGSYKARPKCACVRPGTTVQWNGGSLPWTITFDNNNSALASNEQTISSADPHARPVKDLSAGTDYNEYHYTATLGTHAVDPHVVVGAHPPNIVVKGNEGGTKK